MAFFFIIQLKSKTIVKSNKILKEDKENEKHYSNIEINDEHTKLTCLSLQCQQLPKQIEHFAFRMLLRPVNISN
jgi:hypothetical protein